MDRLEDMVKKEGAQVTRHFKVATHTEIMRPAQEKLTAMLNEVLPNMKPPLYTVWMNSTGEPVRPGSDPADIVAGLKIELISPGLVLQCIDQMRKEGIQE